MKINREQLLDLLRLVDATEAVEIDCEEFIGRVAEYLDRMRVSTSHPVPGFEDLLQHLKVCPECLEEFEALCAAYPADDDR